MTTAQLTFWLVGGLTALALPIVFYPGVRRHAENARDSALAAAMAGWLCAAALALISAFVVNAVTQLVGAS